MGGFRAWARSVLLALLSLSWIAAATGCEISLGNADKDSEEASDDDDGESSKKKKKKKSKKRNDDDEDGDDGEDKPTAKPTDSPSPEPASGSDEAPPIRLSSLASGAPKFLESEKAEQLTYKTVPATGVQIPVSPGWKGKEAGLYKLAVSPDGDALLAFTTVGSVGELTGRMVNVQKIFEVKNYKSEGRKNMKLGPEKLDALFADGSCDFGTTPGDMAWVLVDTGQRRKVLVIVAGKKTASAKTRKQALNMVFNMRKAP